MNPETEEPEMSYLNLSTPRPNLYAALAKAQGQYLPAKQSGSVEVFTKGGKQTKRTHAKIVDIIEVIQKPNAENGLAFMMCPVGPGTFMGMITHESGESLCAIIKPAVPAPNNFMNATQVEGSVVTYWRRYLMVMMFNVPIMDDSDDDDATNLPTSEYPQRQLPPTTPQPTRNAPQQPQIEAQAKPKHIYPELSKEQQATWTDLRNQVFALCDKTGQKRIPFMEASSSKTIFMPDSNPRTYDWRDVTCAHMDAMIQQLETLHAATIEGEIHEQDQHLAAIAN